MYTGRLLTNAEQLAFAKVTTKMMKYVPEHLHRKNRERNLSTQTTPAKTTPQNNTAASPTQAQKTPINTTPTTPSPVDPPSTTSDSKKPWMLGLEDTEACIFETAETHEGALVLCNSCQECYCCEQCCTEYVELGKADGYKLRRDWRMCSECKDADAQGDPAKWYKSNK